MAIYTEADCAILFRAREEFGALTNMHNDYPLTWKGTIWPSSEALYQSLRYSDPEIHRAIRCADNAFAAKKVAYRYIDQTRHDWQDVKVAFMENVLRLKTIQHSNRIETLLELSGERQIVEKSRKDDFWGAKPDGYGKLEGQNVLGLLWMLIREELRQNRFSDDVFLQS